MTKKPDVGIIYIWKLSKGQYDKNKLRCGGFKVMKKKILAGILAGAMVVASATTAFAVEKTDSISGDLTVTTFFNERTDAVELKSGDSYTFKFNNKSNGTNNYENYVMAITGAIGEAYTGTTEEVLIVRADNWGWGGGMSDFVAPDATEGNKLAFETNVADDAAWTAWKTAAQAGFACEVTITRSGDTLTYSAKTGDYTFKTTATSGKALPESCYVFFTGENCELTGFTTVNNNASTTTPSTDTPSGDSSNVLLLAGLAGVAALGAGAVLVSKKRKVEEM